VWQIEFTEDFGEWWESLTPIEQERIDQRLQLLMDHGPALDRPVVDTLTGSRFRNLKELRVGSIRVLFAFDPRQVALLLVGGDKAGEWQRWYREAIPRAEALYEKHLEELRKRGGTTNA